ncbi:MAG: hypothetical protein FJ147_06795 [Deltaproteobacteria bacterium]|nr:hypothetical protein [Deltaproteobacteria bacterium]
MTQEEGAHLPFMPIIKKTAFVLCGLILVLTIRFFPTLLTELKQSLHTNLFRYRMRELDRALQNRPIPRVAGVSREVVEKIVKRHESELKKIPGVEGIFVAGDKIIIHIRVYTDNKGQKLEYLPAHLQALPQTIEGIPVTVSSLSVYPPPPGVIILKPKGKRERAKTCPANLYETNLHGWRFCFDPVHPEPIPGLMMLPIAGIPPEQAYKILDRNRNRLMALPGIESVGMGANGIYVTAAHPSILPKEVEGLRLEVHPVSKVEKREARYTANIALTAP